MVMVGKGGGAERRINAFSDQRTGWSVWYVMNAHIGMLRHATIAQVHIKLTDNKVFGRDGHDATVAEHFRILDLLFIHAGYLPMPARCRYKLIG